MSIASNEPSQRNHSTPVVGNAAKGQTTRKGSLFSPDEANALVARSTVRGIALCLFDFAIVAGLIAGALLASAWWLQLTLGLAAGVSIGVLFVVGHDAAHNSLTDSRKLNYWLGTLAFLPSLHAFSFWVKVHNQIHHRWTNLSPTDYVWTPLSMEEFSALSAWERTKYRFHRSVFGPLTYYLFEFWWRRIFFPSHKEVGKYTREQRIDTLIVAAFAISYTTFLGLGAAYGWFGAEKPWWNAPLYGFLVPFLTWNTLMSFVIYLHHTHPELTWYNDLEEWQRDATQLESSVHVIFPGPINRFFHWIMEHSAHHVRPAIPLYHLPEAQRILEERAEGQIIVSHWTPWNHLSVVRRCKLYDYDAHRWTDYAGEYTSEPRSVTRPAAAGTESQPTSQPSGQGPHWSAKSLKGQTKESQSQES